MIKLLVKLFAYLDNAPTMLKVVLAVVYLVVMVAFVLGIAWIALTIFPEPLNRILAIVYLFAVGFIVTRAGNDHWGQ